MTAKRKILSAEQLDAMTPDQRAAALDERIVHDLDELPEEFRNQIMETGRRLGEELRSTAPE